MLQDVSVVTGMTSQSLEDVPRFQEHPFMLQAKQFVQGGSNPILYYAAVCKSLPQVPGVEHKAAMQLLATIEMALINTAYAELQDAIAARQGGNTKATKPADLYRKYAKALQSITNRKHFTTAIHAQQVFFDLYCEQTLSEGDLNNPDYIDGYTGEQVVEIESLEQLVSEEQHRVGSPAEGERLLLEAILWNGEDEFKGTAPILPVSGQQQELLRWAEQCRQDLGWTDTQVAAFIKANTDNFDAESDAIDQPFDTTDDYTPPTLLPNELELNKELWWSAREAVRSFNTSRSKVFEHMKAQNVKGKNWHATFRHFIVMTPGWQEILATITKIAKADIVTAATLYLSLAGEYGLMREDVCDIRGTQPNFNSECYVSLIGFADEWEDDLLALVQDALSPTSETSTEAIHCFADHTIDDIAATMPKYDPNPIKTASWNIGFIQAAIAGADWHEADNSAWAAWRKAMSDKAAYAYDAVFQQTGSRKKAMSAFWSLAPREVPRPQEKVKAIAKSKMGLILDSGREIHWNIVELKLNKNELSLTNEEKARLLAKLQELNIGKRVWSLLA